MIDFKEGKGFGLNIWLLGLGFGLMGFGFGVIGYSSVLGFGLMGFGFGAVVAGGTKEGDRGI